jgi:hypothetical protein
VAARETIDETGNETQNETRDSRVSETTDETTVEMRVETAAETRNETRDETLAEAMSPAVETAAETAQETNPVGASATTIETGDAAGAEPAPAPCRETVDALAVIGPAGGSVPYRANGHRAAVGPAENGGTPDAAVSLEAGGVRETARGARRRPARPAGIREKMIRYVERQHSAGQKVTGAELDRRFGTVNYGSRVLRELAAEPRA